MNPSKTHSPLCRRRARVPLELMLVTIVILLGGSVPSSASPKVGAQAQSEPGTVSDWQESLRFDVLESSRNIQYEAGGRNIFSMKPEIPLIVSTPRRPPSRTTKASPQPSPANPATVAGDPPEIPIRYFGFARNSGETKKVFLEAQPGEQIFVAAEGDIVAGRYRVVQITPISVTMEDLLTSNRQPIPLTAARGPQ